MLILCPECNAKVSDKAHVCPHCGFRIDTLIRCPDCGKLVLPGTIACPVCGYPFSTAGVSSENHAVPPIHPESGATLSDKMQEGAHVEASVPIASHDGRNSRRRSSNDSAMTRQALENPAMLTKPRQDVAAGEMGETARLLPFQTNEQPGVPIASSSPSNVVGVAARDTSDAAVTGDQVLQDGSLSIFTLLWAFEVGGILACGNPGTLLNLLRAMPLRSWRGTLLRVGLWIAAGLAGSVFTAH